MSFCQGDMVYVKGIGKALWLIEELGDQSFYDDGNPLSESSSKISLYLPEPHIPRSAYPSITYSHREFMILVPAMMVLAIEASTPNLSPMRRLRIKQRFAKRIKKKQEIEEQCKNSRWGKLKLERFREDNPDLYFKQVSFEPTWWTGSPHARHDV